MRTRAWAFAAGLVMAFVPSTAQASGTLDQQAVTLPASDYVTWSTTSSPFFLWDIAQTFTAGLTGTLDHVDLMLRRHPPQWDDPPIPPLSVEIRDVDPSASPGSTVLASATLQPESVPDAPRSFVSISFSTPVPMVAGAHYAIVLSSPTAGGYRYRWYRNTDDFFELDAYAGGQSFTKRFNKYWGISDPEHWEGYDTDAVFRTFVTPPGADSPATCNGLPATIVGTPGNDALVGSPGRDVVSLGAGNDTFTGRGGNDVVCGGDGDDTLLGGAGTDKLFGGSGNDAVRGGPAKDRCDGGVGTDTAACERAINAP